MNYRDEKKHDELLIKLTKELDQLRELDLGDYKRFATGFVINLSSKSNRDS
ncbi:MAG: hypothetical protein N3G78_14635 [Desulfobacterota bacterium]|nr:hypothetical protein [Thermodesulfobacteriota bacterium]